MLSKSLDLVEGAEVKIDGLKVSVKGPKGELEKDFSSPRFRSIKIDVKDKINVTSNEDDKKIKAMIGTIIAHIRNMMVGVTQGYEYKMKIQFAHFPINVEVKEGQVFIKNFLGEKGFRITNVLGDVDVKTTKEEVVISGSNKEDVGQTALNIEHACKTRRIDRRIINDGIYIYERGLQPEGGKK